MNVAILSVSCPQKLKLKQWTNIKRLSSTMSEDREMFIIGGKVALLFCLHDVSVLRGSRKRRSNDMT